MASIGKTVGNRQCQLTSRRFRCLLHLYYTATGLVNEHGFGYNLWNRLSLSFD